MTALLVDLGHLASSALRAAVRGLLVAYYSWMLHAELRALDRAMRRPRSLAIKAQALAIHGARACEARVRLVRLQGGWRGAQA